MAAITTIAAIASATIAAGAAAQQYRAGQKAAKSAKSIAAQNADRAKMESAEAARRLKGQQEANMSEARARAAASGIQGGGSQGQFLDTMESGYKKELDWLKKSGASAEAIELRKGELAAGSASSSAMAGAIGSISSGTQSTFQWYQAGQ